MRRDPTEFRERFQRWRDTGESQYDAGRIRKYEDGKDARKLEYHPEGDYYYGGNLFGKGNELVVKGSASPKLYMHPWKTERDLRQQLNEDYYSQPQVEGWKKDLSKPLSPVDPAGEFVVANAVLNPAFKYLFGDIFKVVGSKGISLLGKAGQGANKLASRTTPKTTAENATSITPEQWTAAQDAAIARGDMAEAQRLRDLHFQVSAPNTVASVNGQPLQLYHGTDATFNAFDISKYGNTDGGTFGRGLYTTPVKEYAELYGKNNMPLYMKLDNPRDYRNSSIGDLIAEKLAFGDDFATGIGIDGVIGRPSWKGFKGLEEYVSHNPKNVKSSLPITYDDNGVRIPLGKRDNFKLNDIRYAIAPFLIGGAAYQLK